MNQTVQTLASSAANPAASAIPAPGRGAAGIGRAPPSGADAPPGPWRVAIVSARWHRDIVQQAVGAIRADLAESATPVATVETLEVPGAFEIPLHAQALARSGRVDAVIACALVVDGGIYRHDFVASAVIDGLMRVQLDTGVPVFSVVLTPHHFHEHAEHLGYFHAHFVKKGQEAASACRATLASLRSLTAAA